MADSKRGERSKQNELGAFCSAKWRKAFKNLAVVKGTWKPNKRTHRQKVNILAKG
jgi:hypothetical protein